MASFERLEDPVVLRTQQRKRLRAQSPAGLVHHAQQCAASPFLW